MDIHHIGPEHISKNISRVYLRKTISGHGYTSHWSGAYLWKYLWSLSPETNLRTWIYITLVQSISLKISLECISRRTSSEKHLRTWIYITLVWSISLKISLGFISRKWSLDMDIHHISLNHISKNISGVYLQNNISGHGYTSHWSGAYRQKYLWSVSLE